MAPINSGKKLCWYDEDEDEDEDVDGEEEFDEE